MASLITILNGNEMISKIRNCGDGERRKRGEFSLQPTPVHFRSHVSYSHSWLCAVIFCVEMLRMKVSQCIFKQVIDSSEIAQKLILYLYLNFPHKVILDWI